MEKRVRSVAKTMSWRIVATSTTILLVFLFTRDFVISASVGSLEVLAKTVIYYVHERIWNVLDFGREVHCTPERE
jgi:adenylylsulfate kinase